MKAGVCRVCGCSEEDACTFTVAFVGPMACSWTDVTRTVCSVCAPAAHAEARLLKVAGMVGHQLERPYHQGFVIGWFGIRGNFRRNPYGIAARPPASGSRHTKAYVWDRGLIAGEAAGHAYRRACGALPNAPRRSVLRSHRRRPTRPGRQVGR